MLRPVSTSRLAVRRGALRPLVAGSVRAASSLPQKPIPMPPDMPREDYAEPAAYTVNLIGRTIKYIIYGTLGLGVTAYLGFEGMHAYVERVCLAPPSHALEGDEYAWADENQSWTGGAKGGTDRRLGWKGRHALRGAWICWEWGAGDSGGTISRHPEFRKGMIGSSVNRVDRGYELADEYIDAAIRVAEQKGITFPPNLPGLREPGPAGLKASQADDTALDLLSLKAGVLERMGVDTLDHARELYARVATAYLRDVGGPVRAARAMRLAHKLGDLAQRAGEPEEAWAWWTWGLERADMALPAVPKAVKSSKSMSKQSKAWWSFGSSPASPTATPDPTPSASATPAPTLPAPVLRAAVSILVSASAASAQAGALPTAAAVQDTALDLLPSVKPSIPGPGQGASGLQSLWQAQRRALLTLHSASVKHAQGVVGYPLEMSAQSADESEVVLAILNPTLPTALSQPRENPCIQPAKRLVRDTLTTGAEAYFTEAALLERSAAGKEKSEALHRLEHAAESYERAMTLSAAEEGQTPAAGFGEEDAIGRGDEWTRYWKGYVRVRDRMLQLIEEGAEPTKHA
ncbi:hypothetical protein CcaverHIS002_0206920 [Cutaneotrichosporon cavernicola]|uniref:Uncharacterized protein n=1 Tax=Cutaneotrichosporon cavernicola TaxID=279322 RepID=A0AA48KYE9_9TREE|nr:uncharacterized protein CcaverHIS019_0206910 [Cutaneotrichosporon cavernicola]BEI81532.1 hypothetical protein CcaverHIS002_0206920 [Cutaneotrichosporon cavernicola]BEI89329.1 hypothetical protein CcaverHIS019_0206910 [Cutaneotrichosporon cavernicola]BEI97104.1 hypothetical protein CcaverHIS631_0206930 [Cutaneotrichosporon cavernicola]BEJ04877.1 hypothetical protein CcaverHIS641_0206940 [Cutaneotrichosporon cavernicola]